MKFTSTLVSIVALAVSVSAVPVAKRGVDPSLVPEFGVTAGQSPNGSGSCVGINNILIPCTCPPDRNAFIASLSANVAAGHDINNPGTAAPFPTDNSIASQITRVQTSISSLQNLNGAGVGCPASSTTFSAQLSALIAQQNGAPAPAAPAPPPPPPAAPAPPPPAPAGGVDPSLVPEFGVTAGQSPNGSGSCVGINNILIPCTCPPDRNTFIASLSANVAAGHDVNNPAIAAPFPTDNSIASQITRVQTAISSLQNLNGAGVGCPASSTTFSAQLAALIAQQ
ncbi:hypothetical protein B0H11DRAFT_2272539 [Mycena galericulata]|nr:hypothetical protein B0H11DRAFT_2272539 [Mycena galericulata]